MSLLFTRACTSKRIKGGVRALTFENIVLTDSSKKGGQDPYVLTPIRFYGLNKNSRPLLRNMRG